MQRAVAFQNSRRKSCLFSSSCFSVVHLFQLPREVVQEQFLLQPLDRGVLRDVDEFNFHHSCPVTQLLGSHVVGKDGVMCAARGDPALWRPAGSAWA